MGAQRTPEEIWSALEKEALEGDDVERAGSMSVDDVVRELAAAGVDVNKEKAEARAFRAELERNIAGRQKAKEGASRERVRQTRPRRRRALGMGLAAAMALVVCAAVAYAAWTRRHLHAPRPALPAPQTAPSAPPPAPSSELIAAELRHKALDACDAKRWDDCLSLLEQARSVDPAGDADWQVRSARRTATAHLDDKAREEK